MVVSNKEGPEPVLRNLRFQSKLVVILAGPLVALAVFAALGIRARLGDVDAARQFSRLDRPIEALGDVSDALEDEMVASTWYRASEGTGGEAALSSTREATDQAIGSFREQLRAFEGEGLGAETLDHLRQLSDRFPGLEVERGYTDELGRPPGTERDELLALDDEVIEGFERIARDLEDPPMADGMLSIVALRDSRQARALEASMVVGALAAGEVTPATIDEFGDAADAAEADLREFYAIAEPDQWPPLDDALAEGSGELAAVDSQRARNALNALPSAEVTASDWFEASEAAQGVLGAGVSEVFDELVGLADARGSDAARAAALYAAGIGLVVVLAIGVAVGIARVTTRRLEALARAAHDVSHAQLPRLVESLRQGGEPALEGMQPIAVPGNDEIGELAEAFSAVQSVMADVAREQSALLNRGISDLFVNLARRNQSLIDRQIELIDRLEADEEDPDALESLFRLDHLATRMRRNAESLLVLADAEQLRRWREPVVLIDVVRAAAAEIADFPRVSISGFDHELAVNGGVAADLTHLMAELLENATSFSPPHTRVSVQGQWADDRFVIGVSDEGLGMPDERLREANELLADPPAAGLALSRVLGLFVVGHLARRHGVTVELRPGEERGISAVVSVPVRVLVRSAPEAPVAATVTLPAPPAPPAPLAPPPPGPAPEPVIEPEPASEPAARAPLPQRGRPPAAPVVGPSEPLAPPIPGAVPGGREPDVADGNGHGAAPTPSEPVVPAAAVEAARQADATWSLDSWVETLFDNPGDVPPESPGLPIRRAAPGDDAVRPLSGVPPPLTTRVPGGNLLHLPIKRSGIVDVGPMGGSPAEPGRSRADQVRDLLAKHRRGIERADTDDEGRGERGDFPVPRTPEDGR